MTGGFHQRPVGNDLLLELVERFGAFRIVEPAGFGSMFAELRCADFAGADLLLNFHPVAIRGPAVFDTPDGAVGGPQDGGNA
jgi:hypothetical protein